MPTQHITNQCGGGSALGVGVSGGLVVYRPGSCDDIETPPETHLSQESPPLTNLTTQPYLATLSHIPDAVDTGLQNASASGGPSLRPRFNECCSALLADGTGWKARASMNVINQRLSPPSKAVSSHLSSQDNNSLCAVSFFRLFFVSFTSILHEQALATTTYYLHLHRLVDTPYSLTVTSSTSFLKTDTNTHNHHEVLYSSHVGPRPSVHGPQGSQRLPSLKERREPLRA